MPHSPTATCQECGAAIDTALLGGVCPRCLLGDAIGGGEKGDADFDGHELLGEIARGGMGVVYRARQIEPERLVALKTLRTTSLDSADAMARFRHESEVMVALDHSAILPVYHCGEQDGIPFFTMKLVEGGTLAERIAGYAGKWRAIAALMATLCDGVRHAHERCVLHRDLKPANVLFDQAGQAYVSDFGIAKLADSQGTVTMTLSVIGTPHYLAPEVAAGSAHAASVSSDVWSLGVILYELLTGQKPFNGESVTMVLRALDTADAVPPKKLRADVPRDLEVITLKALSRDPVRRYSSAQAFADDLRAWLDGRPIAARAVPAPERAWMWARRNPKLAATTVLLVLAVLGAVAALVWGFVNVKRQNTRVMASEAETRAQLRESLLNQARAGRVAQLAGWRAAGLVALRQANAIRSGEDVRGEAVAHIAGFDLEVTGDSFASPAFPSPDFEFFVQRTGSDSVSLLRLADRTEQWRIDGVGASPMSAHFDRAGRWLAVQTLAGGTGVYSRATRERVHQLPAGTVVKNFSDDGSMLSVADEKGARWLRTDDWSEAGALSAKPGEPMRAYFNRTSERPFVVQVTGGGLEMMNWKTGQLAARAENFSADVTSSAAWLDDCMIAGRSDGMVQSLDLRSGAITTVAGDTGGIISVLAPADGPLIITSSQDRVTNLWHAGARQHLARLPGWLADTACTDGARFMVNGAGNKIARIVHPPCLAFLPQRFLPPAVMSEREAIDASPDGRMLLASSAVNMVFRELPSRRLLLVADMPGLRMGGFLADGSRVVVATMKGVFIHQLTRDGNRLALRLVREISLPDDGGMETASLSVDRVWLVVKMRSGALFTGSMTDFTGWRTVPLPAGRTVIHPTISPGGKWIAATAGGTQPVVIAVRDAPDMKPLGDGTVFGAHFFSPDARWLALAESTGALRVYDTETWRCAHTRAAPPLNGAFVPGIGAWDAGGRWFASVAGSDDIEIIETETWRRIALLDSPLTTAITSIEIVPGGRHLVVRRQRGSIELWDLQSLAEELSRIGIAMKMPASANAAAAPGELAERFDDGAVPPLVVNWSARGR